MRAFSLVALALVAATAEAQTDTAYRVLEGNHLRVEFDRSISRVAVGNPNVIDSEVHVLNDREVLLLARTTGRTTLMVWFEDGGVETRAVHVERDFSELRRALSSVAGTIELEVAPDRDALILSGVVPDVAASRAAEQVAERYLEAGRSRRNEDADPILSVGVEESARADGDATPQGAVINLLRVEKLPLRIEERVQETLHEFGWTGVSARRLQHGPIASDETDLLVLTGEIENQVALSRVLHVAARLFLGKELDPDDIEVLSDESGGLAQASNRGGVGGSSGSMSASGFGNSGSLSNVFGGNSANSLQSLGNRLSANLARATALSAADGRILSFLEVTDLPQVRVDIRVYEVNRTDLMSYAPEFSALLSDEDLGGDSVTNVVSFLADGFAEQAQIATSHAVIDLSFRILESRGIARTLSGPSLTVLSGERALFMVGGEIPVPQSFAPAFGTPTTPGVTPGVFSAVEFRPFGVQLGVRPLVGDAGDVTIDLMTQVARPDAALTTVVRETTGAAAPSTAFETRALRTSARLDDGQSMVVGGLIQRRSSDDASYTPWVEQIPGLGWLFKRFSIEDDDLEIVVVVNPAVRREPLPDLDLWEFPGTLVRSKP